MQQLLQPRIKEWAKHEIGKFSGALIPVKHSEVINYNTRVYEMPKE